MLLNPSMRNGTAGKPGAGRWQLLQAGQVLDDGNTGGQQQRVRGPFAVGGVVDVERVDTDQCRVMGGEPGPGMAASGQPG
jgi:hypothetical protein